MTLEEIKFELELAGLSHDQQRKFLSFCNTNEFDAKLLDRKLIAMGFEPVFSIYDDEEEENSKK
jgi:hypothetical protein